MFNPVNNFNTQNPAFKARVVYTVNNKNTTWKEKIEKRKIAKVLKNSLKESEGVKVFRHPFFFYDGEDANRKSKIPFFTYEVLNPETRLQVETDIAAAIEEDFSELYVSDAIEGPTERAERTEREHLQWAEKIEKKRQASEKLNGIADGLYA